MNKPFLVAALLAASFWTAQHANAGVLQPVIAGCYLEANLASSMDEQGVMYAEGTKTCLGDDGQVVSQEPVSFVLPEQTNNQVPVVEVRMRAYGRTAIAGGANIYDGTNTVKNGPILPGSNTGKKAKKKSNPWWQQ